MLDIPQEILENIGRGTSLVLTITKLHEEFKGEPVTIIETGTSRGKYGGGPIGDGWATILWSWYTSITNGITITIDIDALCLKECRILTQNFKRNIRYVQANSLDFLEKFNKNIHLLFLDSADDPDLMFDEFKMAEPLLIKGSFILLDDVGPYFATGKGTKLGPYLIDSNDYNLVYHDISPTTNQALFQKT